MSDLRIGLVLGLLISCFILGLGFVSAQNLMSLHGVTNQTSGTVRAIIYDANEAGNTIYDSGTDFTNSIASNGVFDIQLGSITELNLNYGQNYWLGLTVAGKELLFNGKTRQKFQSNIGEHIYATEIDVNEVNGVVQILEGNTDIIEKINSVITSGRTNIKVQPGSYHSSTTLEINRNNIKLDMTGVTFNYDGAGCAVDLNGGNLDLKFYHIWNTGTATNGICAIGGGVQYSKIEVSGKIGNSFSNSAILLNNTEHTMGNNVWKINTMEGDYTTPYGIYIPNSSYAYEGDSFYIEMMLYFDVGIKIKDDTTSDKEHYLFIVGFDGGTGIKSYIDTFSSKSTFIVKSITDIRTIDANFRTGSSNNIIITSRGDFNYLDYGTSNQVYSPPSSSGNYTFGTQNSTNTIVFSGDRAGIGYNGSSGAMFLYTGANKDFYIQPAKVTSVTFYRDGNTGFGTIKPIAKLDVNGKSHFYGDANFNSKTFIKSDGNLLMTSPNGTSWNCGVTDAGVFSCS